MVVDLAARVLEEMTSLGAVLNGDSLGNEEPEKMFWMSTKLRPKLKNLLEEMSTSRVVGVDRKTNVLREIWLGFVCWLKEVN